MKQIHQEQFRVEVTLHPNKVLFTFLAAWCPACRQMRPELEALERRFPWVKFVEANPDESPVLKGRLDVKLLPLILIYENGQQVHASEGLIATKLLEEKLR